MLTLHGSMQSQRDLGGQSGGAVRQGTGDGAERAVNAIGRHLEVHRVGPEEAPDTPSPNISVMVAVGSRSSSGIAKT